MFLIDPTLYPTILTGAFSLLATLVAGLLTAQSTNRKRLQQQLAVAQADIAFLLQVEALHCAKHVEYARSSSKLRVRQEVTQKGFEWSGRFTPGRVKSDAGYVPKKISVWIRLKLLASRIFYKNRGLPMSTTHQSVYSLISTRA